MTAAVVTACLAQTLVGFVLGVWYSRPRDRWLEASSHDLSILPGGQILHHTTCSCRRPQP